MRTSFRGAKNMQNWKKGCVFGHGHKFLRGHMDKLRKKHVENLYLGSIFIPGKYVLRVFLKVLLRG